MLGPYAYTPPVYWYQDTSRGGAYGLNTETSPGAAPPVLESLKAMIPENHLWPIDEAWDFHCGLNEFSNIDRYRTALERRYGPCDGIEEFAYKAQIMNYELIRPMFEAFRARKGLATGVVQWMLNAAWPKLYWQLYDWHLMPTGAFYGAKTACEPLQLVYDYDNHRIFLVNDTPERHKHLAADIRVFDSNAKQVFDSRRTVTAEPLSSQEILTLTKFDSISSTHFLSLALVDSPGRELASNFYWLSTTPDVLDYDAKVQPWEYYTPSRQFADFTLLDSLPSTTLDISHKLTSDGHQNRLTVTLENRGEAIAFGIQLKLLDADTTQPVVPVFWKDNYFSMLPGERKVISTTFKKSARDLMLAAQAWNMKKVQLQLDGI
jgi:exo-1,4-beta-D-glucosaminidase